MVDKIFQVRRQNLIKRLGSGAVVVFSHLGKLRNGRYHQHSYRQNSNMLYLTGFEEEECALIINPHHPEHQTFLFLREKDPQMEHWNGRRLGVEEAPKQLGIDKCFSFKEFEEMALSCLEGSDILYLDTFVEPDASRKLMASLSRYPADKQGKVFPKTFSDYEKVLGPLRQIKDAVEIENMKKAQQATSYGHRLAMAFASGGKTEKEVHALLDLAFRSKAHGHAYEAIVASGVNATILHYVENNCEMKETDLLLIDAGSEFNGYSSDVTRTFPISGKFSGEQKTIYEIVLEAQKKCIEKVRPGETLYNLHQTAMKVLAEGLIHLKILSGSVDENMENGSLKKFFSHGTSHWLGLDTHDYGEYRQGQEYTPLKEGMVFTVEPGLYFQAGQSSAVAFEGIGVRIEDDILVTKEGHENLTNVPKEVAEVEEACSLDWKTILPL